MPQKSQVLVLSSSNFLVEKFQAEFSERVTHRCQGQRPTAGRTCPENPWESRAHHFEGDIR